MDGAVVQHPAGLGHVPSCASDMNSGGGLRGSPRTLSRTPGNFVMSVRTGNLLYTAGHLPISLDGHMMTGKVSGQQDGLLRVRGQVPT